MVLYLRLRSVCVSLVLPSSEVIMSPQYAMYAIFLQSTEIHQLHQHSLQSFSLQLSLSSIIELINSSHNGSTLRTTERGSRSLSQLPKRNSKETTGMSKCRGYLFIVTDIEKATRPHFESFARFVTCTHLTEGTTFPNMHLPLIGMSLLAI